MALCCLSALTSIPWAVRLSWSDK